MKKTEARTMHYCLCGAEHPCEQLKPGWYSIYNTNKRVKIERVVCPDCLERMGIKVKQD